MERGMWVDCITVPAVNDVFVLHSLQRNTTERLDGKRYGSPALWHFGQVNPFGHRIDSRYFAQAWSFGKTCWNSGRLVGNPRGSINIVGRAPPEHYLHLAEPRFLNGGSYNNGTRDASSCMNRLTCPKIFSASIGSSNLACITGSRHAY